MLKNASYIQMQSFILEEESGQLLVIDGGNAVDAEHLLEQLRQISGQEKPHIHGWIFTHAHEDHMDAFFALLETKPDAFSFDNIYCCFPSVQYLAEEEPTAGGVTLARFNSLRDKIGNRIVTVSVDDVYEFGTARMEVLYTVDCSIKHNRVNNSSTVFRFHLGDKTVLFLGDLGEESGEKLLAAKEKQLHADFCQVAHHGQNGVNERFYQAVAPEACLWCTPDWLWDNNLGEGFDTAIFNTVKTRRWMEKLGVKNHYVIKDGDQHILL